MGSKFNNIDFINIDGVEWEFGESFCIVGKNLSSKYLNNN